DPPGGDVGKQPLQSRPIQCRAGEPAIIITRAQAHPAFVHLAVDESLAGLALRKQRIEFLVEPLLRRFCGCRSHSEPLRCAVCRRRLTSSPAARSTDRSTRSLGQAKKPWTRPMRSGNPLSDHAQRAITLPLIFEPVLANEDGMSMSAP